ncbi:hypothetical protein P775_13735 [Puniceibacterium antarcticum]|uniref:Protein-glutamate methylesterase/protein-glutamine glutaminase n=1 Tax=Puniceibacterium antarcticum TaxID=1206336 RepID=A0A2G8RDH7_9RHOB|nr:chemotaxis response regulator protein-glutamate methylesterase [Puniceibacterium antarcticum]PIL19580.1 hypothetical protein P775_13735 [Puniceibacterium antarcticum]
MRLHTAPGANGSKPIRVMVVDDSSSVRMALSKIIHEDPELELIATAADPYIAAEKLRKDVPDVLILDIEMPRMDGLTFLRKIMAQRPIPVVICSSLTEEGSAMMMTALEAGAVEVIEKPRLDTANAVMESKMIICDALKAAAHASVQGRKLRSAPALTTVSPRQTADVILPGLSAHRVASARAKLPKTELVICIGASTGGTEALRDLLVTLPADCPPIVIVQHMPPKFTYAFAGRLNACSRLTVSEAVDGDVLTRGHVLLAPGGQHMMLRRRGRSYYVEVMDGPHVSRHRPSVDVLFRSAAQAAGPNAIGVILTGMGNDGAQGMKEMHEMGARNLAQDEASSVVFGMPKEAIASGGVDYIVPLDKMGPAILKAVAGTATA